MRLGIVLSVLTLLIAPYLLAAHELGELYVLDQTWLDACIRNASQIGANGTVDGCYDSYRPGQRSIWPFWREAFIAFLILVAATWALVLAGIATIRWILAGRK